MCKVLGCVQIALIEAFYSDDTDSDLVRPKSKAQKTAASNAGKGKDIEIALIEESMSGPGTSSTTQKLAAKKAVKDEAIEIIEITEVDSHLFIHF